MMCGPVGDCRRRRAIFRIRGRPGRWPHYGPRHPPVLGHANDRPRRAGAVAGRDARGRAVAREESAGACAYARSNGVNANDTTRGAFAPAEVDTTNPLIRVPPCLQTTLTYASADTTGIWRNVPSVCHPRGVLVKRGGRVPRRPGVSRAGLTVPRRGASRSRRGARHRREASRTPARCGIDRRASRACADR